MTKKRISILNVILMAITLMGCTSPNKEVEIQVITTTDVHAYIFEYDFIRDTITTGGLSRVASFVEAQRQKGKKQIVLLDNGDLLQGQPSGYYFNHVANRSQNLFATVLNHLQYNGASVGNHDIEMGPDVYRRLMSEFRFPWLAANIIDKKTGEPFFKPYTIIKRKGVKIAVLGLITPSVPNWLPTQLWEGLEFADMLKTAAYWVPAILENEKPDALIGLFHSGAGRETGEQEFMAENASVMVAQNIPGFDVIFTGHDHRVINKKVMNIDGNEVLVLGGQPFARSVSVADFVFKKNNSGNYDLEFLAGDIVEMKDFEPSADFSRLFMQEFGQSREYTGQTIGRILAEIASRDSYTGNSPFVDFIHQIQLEKTGADISLAAPLSFDATLQEGEMTMRDMFRLYPYENYLYVMELTGNEIRNTLEFSYGMWFSTMKGPQDNALMLRKTADGKVETGADGRGRFVYPFFNFDSASGINYTVDISKTPGNRITILNNTNGTPFDVNKKYRVAINSYRGSGGGNHLTLGAGISQSDLAERIVWVSDKDLRSLMADWISYKGELNPVAGNNWKVLPEKWAKDALVRDMKLLFP